MPIPRFKVVLTGDESVGKTSLVHRFVDDQFSESYTPTLGFQIYVKSMIIDKEKVDFQIWDIAGGRQFEFVRRNYLASTQGFFLVFDLGRHETFQHLDAWLAEIQNVCPGEAFVLIGNKADVTSPEVSSEDMDSKTKSIKAVGKILTSAKTGSKVKEAFEMLGRELLQRMKKALPE